MGFTVEEPDPGLAGMIEAGPTEVCHNGHEECSLRRGGPCWQFPCTCTTTGRCMSCTPIRTRIV